MRKIKAFSILVAIVCLLGGGYYAGQKGYSPQYIEKYLNSSSIDTSASQSDSSTATSTAVSSNELSIYFPRAGQDAEGQLISEIGTAKETLDVAIYSFTDTKIANAIVAAKERGVTVRLISDSDCAKNSSQQKAMTIVNDAAIPIKINTHSGIMHMKVSIIDDSVATTGSFNYTLSAQDKNDENFVVINNSKIAQTYETEFESMWNDTSNFKDWS